MHQALEDNNALPTAVLDILPNPVLIKDDQLRYIWANFAFELLFQIGRDDLVGKTDRDVFKERQAAQCNGGDLRVLRTGEVDEAYETVYTKEGFARETITRKSRLILGDGSTYLVGIMHDITDVSETNRRLERQGRELLSNAVALQKMADTDALTGCLNRRALFRDAARQFEQTDGAGALLLLDLDLFKRVNDEHGHQAGDAVLVHFAAVVRSCIRRNSLFARIGGEEFAVALPGTSEVEAVGIAARIADKIRTSSLSWQDQSLSVTTSIGAVHTKAGDEFDIDRLLAEADSRLYEAKSLGRDQVVFASRTPTSKRPVGTSASTVPTPR